MRHEIRVGSRGWIVVAKSGRDDDDSWGDFDEWDTDGGRVVVWAIIVSLFLVMAGLTTLLVVLIRWIMGV